VSKQEEALKHWDEQKHIVTIERLLAVANDPMNPVGQAQVGIQLARVEVPWMLARIAELEALNGSGAQPAQVLGL